MPRLEPPYEVEDLIELFWAGARLRDMAQRAGVTAPRVRDVLIYKWQGHPPHPGRSFEYPRYPAAARDNYRGLNTVMGVYVGYGGEDRPRRAVAALDTVLPKEKMRDKPRRPKPRCEVRSLRACNGQIVRCMRGVHKNDPEFWCCIGCLADLKRGGVQLKEARG